MARRVKPTSASARKQAQSTKELGEAFEDEVADVLRGIPGARVEQHVLIGGKDVDLLVVVTTPFSSDFKIAADAKDYSKPLTRDQTAAELVSYGPLIDNKDVDQFMLVTRHGIATKAKLMFDGKSKIHRTLEDIQNLIVNPSKLIDAMEQQFAADKLNEYYMKPSAYELDYRKVIEIYDDIYSEFITFACGRGLTEFRLAKDAWLSMRGEGSDTPTDYDEERFKQALSLRRRKMSKISLEEFVLEWLSVCPRTY
jgi:hypothetical protein